MAASEILEYSWYAPGTADIFIDDRQFRNDWLKSDRFYLIANATALCPQLQRLRLIRSTQRLRWRGEGPVTNHRYSASLPDQGFGQSSPIFRSRAPLSQLSDLESAGAIERDVRLVRTETSSWASEGLVTRNRHLSEPIKDQFVSLIPMGRIGRSHEYSQRRPLSRFRQFQFERGALQSSDCTRSYHSLFA